MNSAREIRSTLSVDIAIVTVLVLVSGIDICFNKNLTAFEWSAMDMGPFWERQANPDFLKNDFFTNASSDLSPRHFHGRFISKLSHWLDTPWYSVVYFFKLFLLMLFPVLAYKGLESFATFLTNKKSLNVFAKLLLMVCFLALLKQEEILAFFTTAWWKPVLLQVTSSSFSFFLCLLAFLHDWAKAIAVCLCEISIMGLGSHVPSGNSSLRVCFLRFSFMFGSRDAADALEESCDRVSSGGIANTCGASFGHVVLWRARFCFDRRFYQNICSTAPSCPL